MKREDIAEALADYFWLAPSEIVEESNDRASVEFSSPSGRPMFGVTLQRVGVDDWRILGVRDDLPDSLGQLMEVVHGR